MQQLEDAVKDDQAHLRKSVKDKLKQHEEQTKRKEAKIDEDTEQYKKEIHILRSQVLDLKKKIGEYDSAGPAANSEIAVLKKELLEKKLELEGSNKIIRSLRQDLEGLQKHKDEEFEDTSKAMADYSYQKDKSNFYLRTRVNDLTQKVHELEVVNEIEKNDKIALQERCKSLEQETKLQEANYAKEVNKLSRFNLKLQAALAEEKTKFVEHLSRFSNMSNDFHQNQMEQNNKLSTSLDDAKLVSPVIFLITERSIRECRHFKLS